MKTSLLAVLVSLLPLIAGAAPNVVLILADDLGYGDTGCYGSTINRTPNIDALAAGGIRFTDFHSSGPMCTPTRLATLTGRYQQCYGAHFDSALGGKDTREKGIPSSAITLAEKLKEAGYATACFGKWHIGYVPPFLPPNHGFDEFRGLASGDGDYHTHIDRQGNRDWWNGTEIEMEAGYTTDLLTDYAVDFIGRNKDKPFFLYVPHLAIHFPWQGPEDPPHRQEGTDYMVEKFGIVPDPENVAPHVKAMVESLDASVGRIVTSLRENGIEEDTLVIFSSDNGGYLTYGAKFSNISSNGIYRGQKTEIYEGGHRVPTIISWPGTIPSGETDALGHSTDLFPTIANLTEMSVEELTFDGIDLSPHLLRGENLPDRNLFWRMREKRAVRSGPWKLCANGKKVELFHLGDDPGEQNNIAAQHPERLKELEAAWSQWNQKVNTIATQYSPPDP